MPMLAHFEAKGDLRRSTRRSLRLGLAAGTDSVTIHDLSLTGALIETSAAMLVGASFEFELPHAGAVQAVVVWNSGEFYGCEFERPISSAALSAALLQSAPQASAQRPDPVAELKKLSAEVERLVDKLESALKRMTDKED
jgi:PilZ domain